MTDNYKKKLIEVALPLEAINRESAREKNIRHGHPATLHLWWARRPLAACRAVIFSQLVDDPSSRPEEFPTIEMQDSERQRLFRMLEALVDWDNINNETLLDEALNEIQISTGGNPPAIMDLFAGGGSIPLEAQRLGLDTFAYDLNPIPLLINKALIEIPPKWANRLPISSQESANLSDTLSGNFGLAEDVRHYGRWLVNQARAEWGWAYPDAETEFGERAEVVAWLWARTLPCSNPACLFVVPLLKSRTLSTKKASSVWLEIDTAGETAQFKLQTGVKAPVNTGTMSRAGAVCPKCESLISMKDIKEFGRQHGYGSQLLAIVGQANSGRVYIDATSVNNPPAVQFNREEFDMSEPLARHPQYMGPVGYGFDKFIELFSDRQLATLGYLTRKVPEMYEIIKSQALAAGYQDAEAAAYAKDVSLYVGLGISRSVDRNNTLTSWDQSAQTIRNVFARQAMPMVWDYAEANILGDNTGNFFGQVEWIARVIERLPSRGNAVVKPQDATKVSIPPHTAICIDPPYYDNVPYSDLADFFYIWLRRSVGFLFPDLMGTVLTPKADELVADQMRHGSKQAAADFFEDGFLEVFNRIAASADLSVPATVFYAFKQTEKDGENGDAASTGWEKMLTGIVRSGLSITATWPMRTEMANRTRGQDSNALASSVVIAVRRRPDTAVATDRRGFMSALRLELPMAMRALQQGAIAPVDLSQAAIGPGMAIYSSFSKVIETDGSEMSVRTALSLINQTLFEALSEQEGDFDADTRFCLKWFEQFEWAEGSYGEAETLSKAMNSGLEAIARGGILKTGGGKVSLIQPDSLLANWDPESDERISEWEVLVQTIKVLASSGMRDAGVLLGLASKRVKIEAVRELSYQLYGLCDRKGWAQSGSMFNLLGASWNDLAETAGSFSRSQMKDTRTLFDQQ